MNEKLSILLIEDNPGDARLIKEIIKESNLNATLYWHQRLADGIKEIETGMPGVILLDLGLPDSAGIETFIAINTIALDIPVIILTNLDDENLALTTVKQGAQEYLVKGHIDANLLKRSIRYAIERKKAEIALRKSEEKYRSLVENLNDILFQCNKDGVFTFINQKGLDLLNFTEQEVIGKNWSAFVSDENIEKSEKEFKKVLKTGKPLNNFELKLAGKRGKNFTLLLNVSVIRDHKGKIIGFEGISRDITELKEAERQIRRQNRQLTIINQIITLANSSLILDEMLEIVLNITVDLLDFDVGWIYLKDPDGIRAELIAQHGVPVSFIEKKKFINIRDYPYNVIFFAGQPRFIENLPNNPPGMFDTRILEEVDAIAYAGIPLITGSVVVGALYIGKQNRYTFSDLERTTLESIGKEIGGTILRGMLQNQLEEAYEESNCYLDILAHDITQANNELTRQARVLKELVEKPIDRYIDRQISTIHQISEILTNISILRRIADEEYRPGAVDLDPVVRSEMERHPDAQIHYSNCGLSVHADEMLPEIFANLIGNSIKYGGPDVNIWIRTEKHMGGFLHVSVEDSGPGIPYEHRQNIFSWFQSHSTKASGRGLGLHISRLLVQRYGGIISADDRVPGKSALGLAIRFTVPIWEEDSYEKEESEALSSEIPGKEHDTGS